MRRRSCSAAARSSASVETPSSCQILLAVFGPSPGSRMKATTSAGMRPRRLATASISPVSTIWTIFSSIVLPIPCSSFARPSRASCAIEPPVSRDTLRRPAVGEDAKGLGPLQLEHVGQKLELVDHHGVHRQRLRHFPRSYEPCRWRSSASRPTTSARTSNRWSPPCSSSSGPTAASWSSTTHRPTAPARPQTAWRPSTSGSRFSTARPRRVSGRPTWPGSGARSRTAPT